MESEEFIESIGKEAGKICADYNLPASVCIAKQHWSPDGGKYGYNPR
ncbi:hypothetical protein [uncultured Dialister sp.]|nr:hypothetical protein [uncultured Dialister sp.]